MRVIKKYANRRLYDTTDSKHVTLADIKNLLIAGEDIQVLDDTNGDDITRTLLLQILVEQEQDGQPLLNEHVLAQLIRFYGNPMQHMMSDYLQQSISSFMEQQQTIQKQVENLMQTNPVDLFQQNMDFWQSMMSGKAQRRNDTDNE